MLTLRQAAVVLGLAPSTLRRQAALGRLQATKVGRDWLVSREAVQVYRHQYLGRPGRKAR